MCSPSSKTITIDIRIEQYLQSSLLFQLFCSGQLQPHLVIRDQKTPPPIRLIRNRERDILNKMNISNNSKMFSEASLVMYVVRSTSSSYISNAIIACVVNIVLAVAGTILNSFVLYILWRSLKLRSRLSSFGIMLLCSIDLGVVTDVHPLFALKSITMVDSPICL